MSPGTIVIMACVFAISAFATERLARAGTRRWLLDHPNERSLHHQPTTRSGGLAITLAIIAGGVAIGYLTGGFGEIAWLAAGAGIVFAVSIRDDLSHVHPAIRISVHFFVALLLVYADYAIDALELPGLRWPLVFWLGAVLTCLYVVWMINLYNFMDGMDGFAGGMAVFGFGTFAVLGALGGEPLFAGASGTIAAAAGGYLLFNFPPARIFMGDAGSSLLGFLVAGFSLWASTARIFPLWMAVLVFSPFIVDATFTLLRRLGRRERVWEAHKSHCYQRLVELGWGHRKTVLVEYVLMLLCCASAVASAYLSPAHQWWLLSSWAIVYVILIALVQRLEARARSHEAAEYL
jgi:UDP-N-acetylmuramyl pentapeptide phosphotransferase/UDP-N-acetylglucosamine-1-phosphate transferase